jgi:murein DD-endopeptidase MepM/ murein hydrolase activator NlpD
MATASLSSVLKGHQPDYHSVVPFDPASDKLCTLDFTEANTDLNPADIADTERFAAYINRTLRAHKARYGIGGYDEHRTLYARSKHFDSSLPTAGSEAPKGGLPPADPAHPPAPRSPAAPPLQDPVPQEPRRLHLGIDIWGPAGTPVMAPLDGIVHSFAFNNNDSDYGATLILTHQLGDIGFHTLYGHLSLNSLKNLDDGKRISRGEVIGEFGMRFENGNWPPHLHFQVIADMQGWKGDYPGVCKYSERQQWLDNCPDPDLILKMIP